MNKVIIKKFNNFNYRKEIESVLKNEFLYHKINSIKSVFIKPNLVTDVPSYIKNGANTDIRIIEGVLAYFSKYKNITIYLGESETGTKTKGRRLKNALKYMGVYKLKKKYNFKIVNLTNDIQKEIIIPKAKFLHKIKLGITMLNADLIVNLPKIKTHKYSVITCALKNMFGAIPDPMRIIYHQNIHQVLADLNRLFYKKMIIITDGIITMEGQGPIYGNSFPLNIIMFSNNPIANDYIASQIMKLPYRKIKHLKLANEWAKIKYSKIELKTFKPIKNISLRSFKMANKNLFIKIEGFLMQNPLIVKILLNDWVRKNITKKIRFITDKLRGGSYSWYE